MSRERFNTTLDKDIIRELKILAAIYNIGVNDIITALYINNKDNIEKILEDITK